jgi:hypothetical protein
LKTAVIYRRSALLLCILCSGGMLLFPRIPLLFAMLALCFMVPHWRFSARLEPVLVLLAAIPVLSLLQPAGLNVEALAVRYANFVAGLVLLNAYLQHDSGLLAQDLFALLKWMAWQAVLTVPLALVVRFLFVTMTVTGGGEYQTLLLLFNYHVTVDDNPLFVRPDGFFFEPGVFQIYLNLYLYLALYHFRDKRQALLGALAVFATQSTTGIVVALILLAVFAVRWLRGQRWRKIGTRMLLAVALAIPLGFFVYDNISDKLTGDTRGSTLVRQYDLLTGINVALAHPWTGIGFDHATYRNIANNLGFAETELKDANIIDRDSTNGIVHLFYSVGVPLALVFLFGMFRQQFFPHKLLIGLLIFLSLQTESILYTPFFLMLIFSGLLRRAGRRPAPAASAAPADA